MRKLKALKVGGIQREKKEGKKCVLRVEKLFFFHTIF
jgi:hypothetical protein